MSSSHSLSAAEQQSLLSTARFAVVRFTNSFSDKIGHKHFFSKEDIEDMVQDVAMKVWRSLDGYDPTRSKFSTWVGRISVNCVKDAIDYKMKRIGISESMYVMSTGDKEELDFSELGDNSRRISPEAWSATSCYAADREVERKDSELGVWREAHRLGDKNERVIRLLAGGYATKEIAAVEGWTPNAAATRVCRARRALKAALADAAEKYGFHYPSIAS